MGRPGLAPINYAGARRQLTCATEDSTPDNSHQWNSCCGDCKAGGVNQARRL